jgi:hypothetical protein
MLRVKSPQDFGAAVVFLLIGVAGLYFGRELEFGSSARMGPGYFPTLLSWLIILLGAIVGFRSMALDGPPTERFYFRPIVFIMAAVLAFGYFIDRIGLALTTIILTLLAAYARPRVKLPETLVLAIGLALFVVAVFVYGLGQALPPWWGR